MPLPDVRIKIKDGGLNSIASNGTGVHVKIGVSALAEPGELIVISSVEMIKELLGDCPLATAVMDSMQAGTRLIYCIPTEGAIVGVKGEIQKTGTGLAAYVLEGNPKNDYELVFKILQGGAPNEATYVYSLDGGDTFSNEKTIPSDGIVGFEHTGLSIKFTAAATPADSFKPGDLYTFSTKAPTMSNSEVLAAVDTLKISNILYEFIHVVGESTESLWAALDIEAEELFSEYFVPIYFVCEARKPNTNESLSSYVQSLIAARKTVNSYRLQVIASRAEVAALDGRIRDTNGAAIVCGLYSRAKVSKSIGAVEEYQLKQIKKLLPAGIEKYTQLLDEAGFVTFRQYAGLTGYYVTNARMFAPEGSDYQYAETVRTANKASREVRRYALAYEHAEADPTELEAFREYLQQPLDNMAAPNVKEIQKGIIIIPEGQDIIGTSKISVKLSIVPTPILRNIDIEQSLSNPFA